MRIETQSAKEFWGTHKGADIQITKEPDGRFYIQVRHKSGSLMYDGWAPDNVRTMPKAKREALRGAQIQVENVHPDTAWTPYYTAPEGVTDEPCRHGSRRHRIGPTSRKRDFMILVESCGWCGRITRSAEDLSWQQYDWVRRSNARRGVSSRATEEKA